MGSYVSSSSLLLLPHSSGSRWEISLFPPRPSVAMPNASPKRGSSGGGWKKGTERRGGGLDLSPDRGHFLPRSEGEEVGGGVILATMPEGKWNHLRFGVARAREEGIAISGMGTRISICLVSVTRTRGAEDDNSSLTWMWMFSGGTF